MNAESVIESGKEADEEEPREPKRGGKLLPGKETEEPKRWGKKGRSRISRTKINSAVDDWWVREIENLKRTVEQMEDRFTRILDEMEKSFLSERFDLQLETKFDVWKKQVDAEREVLIHALRSEGKGELRKTNTHSQAVPGLGVQEAAAEQAFMGNRELHEKGLGRNDEEALKLSPRLSGCATEGLQDMHQYEFQESIWDASLFIFTEPIGVLGSCTMLFLLILNIGMQALYTMIVIMQFTLPTFDNEAVKGFERFRNKVAHDIRYMDPLTQNSLAAKVCNLHTDLEVAGQQFDALDTILTYMPTPSGSVFGEYTGQVMCWLACITWTLVVVKEFKSCARMVLAVLKHAFQNKMSIETLIIQQDENWIISDICWSRLVFMCVIISMRLTAAVVLLGSGLKFLVHTISLTDLVLNAMALECVLSLDELVFEAFAPCQVAMFLASLEGLPSPSWCFMKGADLHSVFSIFGSAIVLLGCVTSWLKEEVGLLNTVSDALCKGEKNFVMGSSAFAPFYVWANVKDVGSHEINEYAQDMTSAIIEGPTSGLYSQAEALQQGAVDGSYWAAGAVAMWSVGEAGSRWNNMCQDLWPILGAILDYGKALKFKGLEGATSCQDLEPYCDEDTPRGAASRGVCPVTCGCDTPAKKLVLRATASGCPDGCEATPQYNEFLTTAECVDKAKGILQGDPNWNYMASMLPTIGLEGKWPAFTLPALQHLKDQMLAHGCEVVTKARVDYRVVPFNMCDESSMRGFPWKSLRVFCPQSCNCTSSARNCPKTCPVKLQT